MTVRLLLGVLFLLPAVFPGQPRQESAPAPQAQTPEKLWVFIGTYTRGTKSKGIYRCELDLPTGKLTEPTLAIESDNPSFLAVHPNQQFLYAVNEIADFNGQKEGSVSAFQLKPKDGTLELLNQEASGGADPCHLSVNPKGTVVFAANYNGASTSAFLLDVKNAVPEERGRIQLRAGTAKTTGSSINKTRQEAPHPHCVLTNPDGRFLFIADLGVDAIHTMPLDAGEDKNLPNWGKLVSTRTAFGAGPRHLAFHPNGKRVYAINELNSTVAGYQFDEKLGTLRSIQVVSTLPKSFKGTNTTAEVVVHPSGKFLYGSNRGHNSIAVFKIDDLTGRLTPVGLQDKNIKTPRSFAIDPTGTFLLVANQDADNIVLFRIDQKTGMLTDTDVTVPVPRPACIQMVPRNP